MMAIRLWMKVEGCWYLMLASRDLKTAREVWADWVEMGLEVKEEWCYVMPNGRWT